MSNPTPFRVLCAPYHIYTHHDVLAGLFRGMDSKQWEVSVLLPFTSPTTLDSMAREAEGLAPSGPILDFTSRRLVAENAKGTLGRALRALALLVYFVRTACLLLFRTPDALLLTSDLGGVSVRFVQLLGNALGVRIFTLQSTLFLKLAEREDLKFEFRPRWLHRCLSRGVLKKLFLFFGEVPGTFLRNSYVGVQDDEIRRVCIEFGKAPRFIRTFGSLQAAKIRAARAARAHPLPGEQPRVLFLSECISERYGDAMGQRNIEWMRACASALSDRARFVVRFHPREPAAYRQDFMDAMGPLCSLDEANNAVDAAAAADVIVGAYSMLMFDAQAAGVSTVFLDVGEDPLGFYAERRSPLVDSSSQLIRRTAEALNGEGRREYPSAATPEIWVERILNWILASARSRNS